jgi:hypothetical protein
VATNSSRLCFVSSLGIALFLQSGSRKGRTGGRGARAAARGRRATRDGGAPTPPLGRSSGPPRRPARERAPAPPGESDGRTTIV